MDLTGAEDIQSHFVRCILEELRQVHAKTLNYAKLANRTGGEGSSW